MHQPVRNFVIQNYVQLSILLIISISSFSFSPSIFLNIILKQYFPIFVYILVNLISQDFHLCKDLKYLYWNQYFVKKLNICPLISALQFKVNLESKLWLKKLKKHCSSLYLSLMESTGKNKETMDKLLTYLIVKLQIHALTIGTQEDIGCWERWDWTMNTET